MYRTAHANFQLISMILYIVFKLQVHFAFSNVARYSNNARCTGYLIVSSTCTFPLEIVIIEVARDKFQISYEFLTQKMCICRNQQSISLNEVYMVRGFLSVNF